MDNKRFRILTGSAAACAILAATLVAGYALGIRSAESRVVRITDGRQLIDADFNLFWKTVDTVKQKHVSGGEVEDGKLLYGAIKGAIGALDDPYTAFFPPEDAKKFADDLRGDFGGIGAEIGIRSEQLVVVAPLKGNPAETVGLRPLDKILKIDGKDTAGMSAEEAVRHIRGPQGTAVTLNVWRDGWREAKDFKITRATIVVPAAETEIKKTPAGDNVAWVRVYNFNANVSQQFAKAAQAVLDGKAKGIVLDVRGNSGGYLDAAQALAGWFLPDQSVLVAQKKRDGAETKMHTVGNGIFKDMPLVMLVNGGSASASEILAGALRDDRGAKLIGEKTFGKGSVQEVVDLPGGATVKVTIAHWYTPSGALIDKTGLVPDVAVKISDADYEKGKDTQLDAALAELGKIIGK